MLPQKTECVVSDIRGSILIPYGQLLASRTLFEGGEVDNSASQAHLIDHFCFLHSMYLLSTFRLKDKNIHLSIPYLIRHITVPH